MPDRLQCCVFSSQGLALAFRLTHQLKKNPWQTPGGCLLSDCNIYVPARIYEKSYGGHGCVPFTDAAALIKEIHPAAKGFVFIGATGIAVRLMAPTLIHKSVDPPVVCMDSSGHYAISLIGGHLGGANRLARHVAILVDAIPVITTNSDISASFSPALDLFLQHNALRILDWDNMATAQAIINEGQTLPLHDPFHYLPTRIFLDRMDEENFLANSVPTRPGLLVDWKDTQKRAGIIRVAPLLHIGIGCRKKTTFESLQAGFHHLLASCAIEIKSIASLATITEKEAQIRPLAQSLNIPLFSFFAAELAKVRTPNPSTICGNRFGTQPFSVSEAAAILAANNAVHNPAASPRLLQSKTSYQSEITFAVASACVGELL